MSSNWSISVPANSYGELPVIDPNKNQGYPSFTGFEDMVDMPVQIEPFPKMINIYTSEYYEPDEETNLGYPHILDLPNIREMKVLTMPFPKMIPGFKQGVNQGYPYVVTENDITDIKTQSTPFPRMIPGFVSINNEGTITKINQGYPCLAWPFFIDITEIKVQEKPYPKMLPSLEGKDYNEGFSTLRFNDEYFGAGNNTTIEEIVIPRSVMYISDYAFYYTNIKSVRFNKHCTYFRHSFPPGCVLIPYKEDE